MSADRIDLSWLAEGTAITPEDIEEMGRRMQEWHDSLPSEYLARARREVRIKEARAELWWSLVRSLRVDRLAEWLHRRLTPPPRPEDYDFRGLR